MEISHFDQKGLHKNRSIRLKILTYESPMQGYIKNRAKLSELIQFNVRNHYLLSSSELLLTSAVFCTVFVYRNEKYN